MKRTVTKNDPEPSSSSSSASSSEDESTKTSSLTRPKHMLKPPKFDGTTSFETFSAQFQNCVEHNRWNKNQKLVFLKSSLDKV